MKPGKKTVDTLAGPGNNFEDNSDSANELLLGSKPVDSAKQGTAIATAPAVNLGDGEKAVKQPPAADKETARPKAVNASKEIGGPAASVAVSPGAGGITKQTSNAALLNGGSAAKINAGEPQTLAATPTPWTALFKDNRDPKHGIKLRYVPPKGDTLDFGDRVLPSMVQMWGFCLVGHFTGKFPGLKAVHEIRATWGVKCLVRSHNKGWVIFKFTNEEDRSKVLLNGPYNVFGKLLMLKELSDDFSFEYEEFLKVPIWVKFPKLSMKLWNDEAMSEVASLVGVPITTDKITQERTNNEYSRVLIEVDVSKPPSLSFPIRLPSKKVFKQSVLYETFSNYCFHCKQFGHHPFICKEISKRGVEGSGDKGKQVVESIEKEQGIDKTAKIGIAQGSSPTGCQPDLIGLHRSAAAQGTHPTGYAPNPIGSHEQTAQVYVASISEPETASNGQFTTQGQLRDGEKLGDETDVNLEAMGRIVRDESDLKQDDVVTKCEVINGKTLKLLVKPFRYVCTSVIRVDTSLRLTDDLDKKGLTFTAHCPERLPGVTKKKGEVCYDSKFTTPFRAFFGC